MDATTAEGKAPGAVARRCARLGVRCVVAGGVVTAGVDGAETLALSGDPAGCAADLRDLGLRLAAGRLGRCVGVALAGLDLAQPLRELLEQRPCHLGVLLDDRPEAPHRQESNT